MPHPGGDDGRLPLSSRRRLRRALARNAATSVGAGAGIAGGCAVIFGAGRLIERRLARSRGVPVGEFRYRPGRIARPLLVVAGALLVLFFALAIAVEIADAVQLDTK